MIRTVKTSEITENIKEMCIEANYYLSRDMDAAMECIRDMWKDIFENPS